MRHGEYCAVRITSRFNWLNPPMVQYDACFIALSDIRTDARTVNIAQALAKAGKRVCMLVPDWCGTIQIEAIDIVTFPCIQKSRLWKKWIQFRKNGVSTGKTINSKSYWAADLYSLPVAVQLAKRNKAKVVYDSREIYSTLGPLHKHPIKQAAIASIERRYAQFAHTIIVSGEMDAEYIRQHLQRNEKPDVVMNVPPYSQPQRTQKLRARFSIPEQCIISVYQGAVLEGRGIEPMMQTVLRKPDLHFCVLGDGPMLERYKQECLLMGISERVHFAGAIPYNELPEWTASADVGICYVEPISFSYSLALPNKLFEYAMARIPAIVSDLPAMRQIVTQYPFGELLPNSAPPEHIASAITHIIANKERYISQAEAIAKLYNRESQEEIILKIFTNLVR